MLGYKSGIAEVMTKITILRDEFEHVHDTNPIEHIGSRLKSPESLIAKVRRKGCPLTLDAIREQIWDIAGVRVTCSFVSDIYRIRDLLISQQDLTVLAERDYIAEPKANGYQSLHLIVQVPVFLSDRVEAVTVEIQIRTIAMDFWASLEHKIYYKYDGAVPERLLVELREAALAAARLDATMEQLHDEVRALAAGSTQGRGAASPSAPSDELLSAFTHLLDARRVEPPLV
ncbi:GTP pyrophosphokinase [Cellulomonas soli]|uniref:GTP pyrophosphokinase n=1 Tax=Cellulomonas soli TaxID=931535 RepID=UPI003F837C01